MKKFPDIEYLFALRYETVGDRDGVVFADEDTPGKDDYTKLYFAVLADQNQELRSGARYRILGTRPTPGGTRETVWFQFRLIGKRLHYSTIDGVDLDLEPGAVEQYVGLSEELPRLRKLRWATGHGGRFLILEEPNPEPWDRAYASGLFFIGLGLHDASDLITRRDQIPIDESHENPIDPSRSRYRFFPVEPEVVFLAAA